MVTEAGPNRVLFEGGQEEIQMLKSKIEVSLNVHGSHVIAIAGHYDCAGNPVSEDVKRAQIKENVARLKDWYSDVEGIGLWVNENWEVERIV